MKKNQMEILKGKYIVTKVLKTQQIAPREEWREQRKESEILKIKQQKILNMKSRKQTGAGGGGR